MRGGVKMPGGGNGGEALSGVAAGTTDGAEIGVSCIAAGASTRVAGTAACGGTGVGCDITGS